ncbi:cell division protein FtsQ/DivIB [Actinotalea solisilvae]|uniref:cell division protein FtsQ/DivIB n=1 Tax=Actinotalea solisilvae TaxID=2072922 RepID=UPI0018F1A45A|nr:cell division protein FtsQ/DivIB [Actinotalea solisilvae]
MRPPATPRRVAPLGDPAVRRPAAPPAAPPSDPPADPPAAARRDVVAEPDVAAREAPSPAPEPPASASPGASGSALVVPGREWRPVRPAVVSDAADRFAERAAVRRHLLRRRVVLAVVAVLAAGALGWLLLLSPVLALDAAQVRVEGQGTVVDAAAVAAVVAPHDGTPLPRLDTVALRRAVLDVPGVRAAEVAREWPHGLLVTVVSREPVAAVPQTGGGVALLDVEGVQVGRSDTAPEGLPVVSVPLEDPGARALTAVLTVLQQLPPELAAQVETASADSQDAVRFGLRDGVTVEWGSADQTALKIRVLQTLRTAAPSATATHYDVSAPELPITRS